MCFITEARAGFRVIISCGETQTSTNKGCWRRTVACIIYSQKGGVAPDLTARHRLCGYAFATFNGKGVEIKWDASEIKWCNNEFVNALICINHIS